MAAPGATVLIIDDDPQIHAVLQRAMQSRGLASLHATTIPELITAAEHRRVDAFIVDLNLRGEHSGLDVLGWIRTQPEYAETPIVVLTGLLTIEEDEEALIRRNQVSVFYKGTSLAPLLDRIEEMLGRRPDGSKAD